MSNAVPWKELAPDFVVKLSMPPEVRPNSAERVEVVTLNSLIASMDGAFSSKVGPSSAWEILAPSRITSVPKFWPPANLDSKTPEDGLSLAVPGPYRVGRKEAKGTAGPRMARPAAARPGG